MAYKEQWEGMGVVIGGLNVMSEGRDFHCFGAR